MSSFLSLLWRERTDELVVYSYILVVSATATILLVWQRIAHNRYNKEASN